jgi:DNA-binding NtrC family response regulator
METEGPRTRRIEVAGRAATELTVDRLQVKVTRGPDQGASAKLRSTSLRIGSAEGNDLVLADPDVSRQHLILTLTPDGVLAEDLESTNGTFLGDARIRSAFVPAGGEVRVGSTVLEVHAGPEPFVVFPDEEEDRFQGMVSRDPAMHELFALVRQLARTDLPIAVTGETGTGKELLARALHDAGPRKDRPFLVLDCGSVLPELLRSELFGHEKGAFTGADKARAGVLEAADGGTVFLDEVGELDLAVQPNLLRALEMREVTRMGSTKARPVDFRIVSATNRDLAQQVEEGTFRADLYYRLSGVTLELPPLRERLDDLPLVLEAFLADCAARHGTPAPSVSPAALEALREHAWPGNLRELRNAADALCVLANSETIEPRDVDRVVRRKAAPPPEGGDVPDTLEEAERRTLLKALESTGWKKKTAARKLGISPTTLYKKIKDYGLEPEGD